MGAKGKTRWRHPHRIVIKVLASLTCVAIEGLSNLYSQDHGGRS